MISMIQPLHSGNALRLLVEPPPGAVEWKILRKGSSTFTGLTDPGALLVYQGDDRVITDIKAIQNEVMQFYCPFYTVDGTTWNAGPVANGTAHANYEEFTTDVMEHIRDRLEAGLKVECDRGNFQTELGYIQVYTAPPSMEQGLRFPLVTVHMQSEEPAERTIGDCINSDEFDGMDNVWLESEGWLADVRIAVVGWALNSDARIELRKAIRRVILANLTVFDGLGWVTPSYSQQADVDAVNGEYPAQLYQCMGTFSCIAPVRVGGSVGVISSVISRSING